MLKLLELSKSWLKVNVLKRWRGKQKPLMFKRLIFFPRPPLLSPALPFVVRQVQTTHQGANLEKSMFLVAGFYCTVKERITFLINFINEISVCFSNTLYIIADIAFLHDTFRKTAFGRASSIIGFGDF